MRLSIILIMLLIIFSIISIFLGAIDVNIIDILKGDINQLEILLISRFPRLLAILLSGMSLSVAGLIMQQLCKNNFVSPTTGGTIASAQLGILISLIFFPNSTLFERSFFAFLTAILGTWIFVAFIQSIKFKDSVMVALVGIMFGYVIGGITTFLSFKFELVQALSTWLTGSFSLIIKGRYEMLYISLPLIILALIFANYFNIVGMGKDFSKNLGVPYNFVLFAGLSLSAMLSAGVVVVVGAISYIGLIVPNIIRIFKGDNLKGILVDTALFGALFVLVCDVIARLVIMPYELPIELISGILGSIVFISLIIIKLSDKEFKIGNYIRNCGEK